eukprot:6569360-Pyramimonas_sp.AAC.1
MVTLRQPDSFHARAKEAQTALLDRGAAALERQRAGRTSKRKAAAMMQRAPLWNDAKRMLIVWRSKRPIFQRRQRGGRGGEGPQ